MLLISVIRLKQLEFMKKFVVVMVVFLTQSCGQSPFAKVDEEKMVSVLVDIAIATEVVAMSDTPKDTAVMYMQSVYKPRVLSDHGLTEEEFDEAFVYFSERPDKMARIQTAVSDSLRALHLKGKLDF